MTECLYDLLYMLPICFITAFLSFPYLQGPKAEVWPVLVALLSLGIFVVLKHWKNRLKYIIPGIVAIAVVTVIFLQPSRERIEFLLRNAWVLQMFITGLGSFLAGWLIASNRLARRIFSAALGVLLILNLFLWKIDSKISVAFVLFLLLLFAADEIQHGWKKSGYADEKKHLVFIAPFLLAMGIAVFQIPAPAKPLDWTFVVRAARKVASYVKENTIWLHTGEDYEAEIGFTDEGVFHGEITGKSKEVLQLKSDVGVEPAIYLGGKVMDTFDGREWSESYVTENNDRMIDTMELLCAVNSYDKEHASDYIRRTNISLTYLDFYTKYCFAPMKAVTTEHGFGNIEWTQYGGDLIAKKMLGYKKNYLVSYYLENRENEKFKGLLASPVETDEDKWDEANRDYATTFRVSYEEYLRYRENVYAAYLPETKVSSDTEEYLSEILDGAETDYEKCSRLESMLSSMQYTRTPGILPEKVTSTEEFLDYFLFEKQEGYCFYFASAFVLMTRNQGIPARMVQGYRVKPIGGKTVNIVSDSAHAWAEAYIKDVGWVVFDPTPGAPEYMYWTASDEKETEEVASPVGIDLPEKQENNPLTELPTEQPEKKKFNWKYIWIPVAAIALLLLIYLILDRLIAKAKYEKLSVEEKFRSGCKKNIRILEYRGYRMEEGETPAEYGARISKKMDPENVEFISFYERYCYADSTPGEEELTLVDKNTGLLLAQLKSAKRRKYFLYYFRLMKYT